MSEPPIPSFEFDPQELVTRVDLEIPGHFDAITPAVDEVLRAARTIGCASGKEFEIETALREALANAIRHGCGNDPGKHVQICVACDEERGMLIVVRDPGPGFEPESVPSPIVAQNLYSHHGRGIYLINQLMDEVAFGRGGTEIHMRKR